VIQYCGGDHDSHKIYDAGLALSYGVARRRIACKVCDFGVSLHWVSSLSGLFSSPSQILVDSNRQSA
jgi:hypothetical protein